MKRTILLMMFAFCFYSACGQKPKQESPLLISINNDVKPLGIKIECACISDSMEVVLQVNVHFDEEVSDLTKTLYPKKIHISWIIYNLDNEKQVFLTNINNDSSPLDSCIWETCSTVFLRWMKDQPYNKLYKRELQPKGGKGMSFVYKVALIPTGTHSD